MHFISSNQRLCFYHEDICVYLREDLSVGHDTRWKYGYPSQQSLKDDLEYLNLDHKAVLRAVEKYFSNLYLSDL